MGSSSGTSNPMYLSQGGRPMPGLPIAGQGAPNDNPRNFGSFQEFLPTIQQPGGTAGGYTIPSNAETRAAPSATGLKSEMFQYRSPQGAITPIGGAGGGAIANSGASSGGAAAPATASSVDTDSLRQQLAALQNSNNFFASGSNTDGPPVRGFRY